MGSQETHLGDERLLLLDRKIDLHTAAGLSRYLPDDVLREAQVVYADEE
jgi:predicted nucleotidyltransferase